MIMQPSPNFNDRPDGVRIKYLILHYTGMATGQAALKRLCDKASKVSAHYMIEEDGRIFVLVPESRRAWHAGVSAWGDDQDINGLSIGIELVNPGHDSPGYKGDYRPFPEAQMTALITLCRGILSRHDIRPWYILGHSDIAPARKSDPGELFDWQRMAEAGIGVWPLAVVISQAGKSQADKCDEDVFRQRLAQYGYDIGAGEGMKAAIIAFQRHFRPADISGVIDGQCCSILENLLTMKNAT